MNKDKFELYDKETGELICEGNCLSDFKLTPLFTSNDYSKINYNRSIVANLFTQDEWIDYIRNMGDTITDKISEWVKEVERKMYEIMKLTNITKEELTNYMSENPNTLQEILDMVTAMSYVCSKCGKTICPIFENGGFSISSSCIRGGIRNEILKDNICDDCKLTLDNLTNK